MEHDVLLEMKNISKEFPGVKALDNVSLTVRRGTVHALMGENGAGKSTLMKCLFGMYVKDGGSISLEGKEINFKNSKEALENGVAMVHQELNQALKRSVMDNIWLGRYPKKGPMVDEKKMYDDTKALFDKLEIDVDPKRIMSTMPVSQRQMAEIAKAVSFNSKIIVFDEPTSSLTEEEVEHLFKIINMLRDQGCGIIYISHKMAEILRISDDITVMRDGTWVATKPAKEMTMDEIIRLMVGRELTNQFPPKTNKAGEVALEVEHLSGQYSLLNDVSFNVRKGEIVCIAGIDGNGQSEFVQGLTGLEKVSGGKILFNGQDITKASIRDRSKMGMSHIPEDRHKHGLVLDYSIEQNMVLQRYWQPEFESFGFIKSKAVREYAERLIEQYDVRSGQGPVTITRSMSGGNQQKAIIAREIDKDPDLLVAVQPTRGLDVGAIEYIHSQLVAQRDKGKAVLLVSLELDEVMDVSDRILVMYEGELVGQLDPKTVSVEELGLYMAGAKRDPVPEEV